MQTDTPIVEIEKTQQADTITAERIVNLPINKRNFLDLTLLTPGVTDSRGLITYTLPMLPTSGLSFMGQNSRYNNISIDGVDNNDNSVGAVRSTLSQEAVQEFQVNRSNFSAEFGRSSGGLVNIVSKSGTNIWHGDIFAFLRDQKLDARNPFAFGPNGSPTDPPFRRVQAGFTLGGPIKRDRTFFFLSYEGLRRRESNFVSFLENPRFFQPTPSQEALITATPCEVSHWEAFASSTSVSKFARYIGAPGAISCTISATAVPWGWPAPVMSPSARKDCAVTVGGSSLPSRPW